jgi:hypothetical protein
MTSWESPEAPPEASVVVISIFGGALLERCLEAIRQQQGLAGTEVIVVPGEDEPPVLTARRGERFLSAGSLVDLPQRVAEALQLCRGRFIVLTEDHLDLPEGWIRRLIDGHTEGRAAVGGSVAPPRLASTAEWAFYFTDFFRYVPPCPTGPSATLTVCNVSYRRRHLEAIRGVLSRGFLETAVNEALAARFGTLWLDGQCTVRTVARGPFGSMARERYQLARHFASVRLLFWRPWRRWLYAAGSPLLPAWILVRMTRRSTTELRLFTRFVRALPALLLLTLAWSWGELLGYVTGRPPREIRLAQPRPTAGPDADLG